MNLRDALNRYPDLTPDERLQVDARVPTEAPHYADDLAWMQRLTALLSDLGSESDRAPHLDDDTIAHLVASELIGGPQSRAVDETWSYLRERLERDGDLRARVDSARAHAERIERASEDPIAAFERLSGHSLSQPKQIKAERSALRRRTNDRPAAQRAGRPARTAFLRYALMVAFVLVGLYGVLGIASRSSLSELQMMGVPGDGIYQMGREQVFRGDVRVPGPDSNDARFRQAINLIKDARETTIGLFPRYDRSKLSEARTLLQAIRETEEENTFLHLEALYLLGKTMLLQEDAEAALARLHRTQRARHPLLRRSPTDPRNADRTRFRIDRRGVRLTLSASMGRTARKRR